MSAGSGPILVLGFGPFGEILDNPAARLAGTLRGQRAGRVALAVDVMPVSYARSPRFALDAADRVDARAVLGIGVARSRESAALERTAVNLARGLDMDGQCPGVLDPYGPERLTCSDDVLGLADALGIEVSDDAGRYVCNAWLYRTARAGLRRRPALPVGFLHIPMAGFDAERLRLGLGRVWGDGGRKATGSA